MTTCVWPHRNNPFGRAIAALELQPVFEKVSIALSESHSPREARITQRAERVAAMESAAESAATTRTIRIVMAGGGTGGHLYPGLAVAAALRELLGDRLELLWAATPRTVDQRLLSGFGDNFIKQTVRPLKKSPFALWPFVKAWRESVRYWRTRFADQRIDAVLALGGYAAGPAAKAASEVGVPVALLNPDALPGLANRYLLKRSERVFSQWNLPLRFAKRVRGRVIVTGCPIRNELLAPRERTAAAAQLQIDPSKKTLVVTGASLGAKTINDALLELLGEHDFQQAFDRDAGRWQIVHLAGMDQAIGVAEKYAAQPQIAVRVIDYCDDMAAVWSVADLAIARSGASTCAELLACHVPAILLPYPFHRDDHQKANALELVRAGSAIVVDDLKLAGLNAEAIKGPLLSLLYDDQTRERMVEAALVAARPQASRAVAEELISLIRA